MVIPTQARILSTTVPIAELWREGLAEKWKLELLDCIPNEDVGNEVNFEQ